jgi:SAM-dependent methyltransferase
MALTQDEIFAASEGDRWFDRNKDDLEQFDPQADLPLRLMDLYHLRPRNVLEIGASNGVRLAAISERYGASVVAVEPSRKAIGGGKIKFPHIEFVQGTASTIPLQESFDLIIVHSVFHWIDRTTLLRSVAEIDRLIVNGGFLIIGDFYPSNLIKVRYHHLTDQQIYTYKQNYAATFLASGLYHIVCLITWGHASPGGRASPVLVAEVAEDKRFGVWLLRKTLHELYVESSLPQ